MIIVVSTTIFFSGSEDGAGLRECMMAAAIGGYTSACDIFANIDRQTLVAGTGQAAWHLVFLQPAIFVGIDFLK